MGRFPCRSQGHPRGIKKPGYSGGSARKDPADSGVDVGYVDEGLTSRAAVALPKYPGLELVTYATAQRTVTFPYYS